jgi:hypothetical protein
MCYGCDLGRVGGLGYFESSLDSLWPGDRQMQFLTDPKTTGV